MKFPDIISSGSRVIATGQHLIGIDPLTREPSHGLPDASLTVTGRDGRWSLQIYGKNLTDSFLFAYRSNANNVLGRSYGWPTRDYRRYGGLQLTARM